MSERYCMHGEWFTREQMIERRHELTKIIADLERDLEIARAAIPDLEAARKITRDLAVVRDVEFKLALAQAEFREIEQKERPR
jgi:hypothetical protein